MNENKSRQKKSPPGDAAAPRDFGGVASEPGVGVTRGGFSRRGQRRGQRFGEVLLRGERVLTGHPVLIELLHALLAHLFALTNRRQACFHVQGKKKPRADHIKVRCTDKKLLEFLGQFLLPSSAAG